MMRDVMLTTIDNPFNPFDDFSKWFLYDSSHGYESSRVLDNLVSIPDGTDDETATYLTERAIDLFVESDPLKLYRKVVSE